MENVNRKLIRPNLAQLKEQQQSKTVEDSEPPTPPVRHSFGFSKNGGSFDAEKNIENTKGKKTDFQKEKVVKKTLEKMESAKRKTPPTAETLAELYYYKKQIDSRTVMVIVLNDGEEIEGTIEWYDKDALKINRTDAPNILLLKHNIKYMFKAEDEEKLANGA